jgi:Cu-processing system ATP-binding protein
MVKIENLYKRFGKLEVLKGVELELVPGRISVIMGPNGSGKTTLIKCILGLVLPNSGEIYINGESIKKGCEYRRNIGYMPQIAQYPENLNPTDLINMIKDIRSVDGNAEELIELFGLESYMKKPLRILSGGTRQKVNAVMALQYDNQIMIFDEPTVGLDPVSRLKIKDKIHELREQGKVIMLTTHVMSEIEDLADEIVFMLDGKIYLKGSPADIKSGQGEKTLERAIAKILVSNGQS